ncbi:hypothetical protein BTW56_26680 [Salmonella enterica]|uniref:Uncharacterized protein n=1 Tax=Salmonella enterica TaxID=28901 RepID=A0A5Y6EYU6_SALER|nr:hypothetical protein [Salmonella enterica]EBA5980458.1 hypothetical protein [Salmonella enterica]ECK6662773.1 hypothetical protein [Salmonella enterica]ECP0802133.1 hypothetical protein [Salmonella enterica]ECR1181420.1 hypothetical protein [Salmonella enterica]
MVRRTGFELPDQPTGEPYGSPARPTIMRRCGYTNDNKKDAGASLSRLVFRGSNPDIRFCGCQMTITPEDYYCQLPGRGALKNVPDLPEFRKTGA